MIRDRLKLALMIAGVAVLAGALFGCGRNGPLDPPPSAAVPPPPAQTRFNAAGRPRAATRQVPAKSQVTPPPNRPFFLDPLLQ